MRRFVHRPLIGTVVEVQVVGADDTVSEQIDAVCVAAFERLQGVFSVYDRGSELERWKRGAVDAPGTDLGRLLAESLAWQHRSGGRFNVGTRLATDLWRAAEQRDEPPPAAARRRVAEALRTPPFEVAGDTVMITGDVSGVDLNALAKGWIVDRALDAAFELVDDGEVSVAVNAGGDLCHRGRGSEVVGIENPLRPYDNEPPIASVVISNEALASSGPARRGFRVGGRWYGHVIDPRTAEPVDSIASISVVAADAATADVLTTVAGLDGPAGALSIADDHLAACFVVAPDGTQHRNERWEAIERS